MATKSNTSMCIPKAPSLAKMRVEQAFAQQLQQQPHAPAIIFANQTITYEQLNIRAKVIAAALKQLQLPAKAGVGVLVNRSAQLPQSCLGIYQAGGVYVPLMAELPAERLAYIIDQAQIDHVIALDGLTLPAAISRKIALIRPENLNATTRATMDITPNSDSNDSDNSDDIAAILFTSGSTGVPKGVMLSHKAIAHMILGHVQAQHINSSDRILLSASPSYILGFREVHFTFYTGACHVAISRKQLDHPQQVLATMASSGVTVAMFTPSYLRLFDGQLPKGLKTLITAGEKPNLEDAKQYAAQLDYWNCHGATETCGTFSMYQVHGDEQHSLPSGIAFPNTQILLLDENQQQVPEHQEGYIYVVSDGLALGYLNNPSLSAQTFVSTPWGRAYNTKELGRLNQQGQLCALGRIDDAVKIDGQTVMLSEIEQALKQHHQVTQVIALLVEKRLTAVIETAITPTPSQSFWRGFLANQLASYMIPAHFACIDKVPVNASGKACRVQLTEYAQRDFAKRPPGSLPANDTEQQLADLWQQELGIENIYREDNFFTLGGTSLIAISISTAMTKQGYQLLPHQLLATPILSELANKLAEQNTASQPLQDVAEQSLEQGMAYHAAQDFYHAWQLEHQQSALVITRVLDITGHIPSDSQLQQTWQHLCMRHASLHTEFYQSSSGKLKWRLNHHAPDNFEFDTVNDSHNAKVKIKQYFSQPLIMTEAPLARAGVIHIQQQQTLVWFVLHHSVIDGISAQLIQNEFFQLLKGDTLPKAAHGPAMMTQQENHYLASPAYQRDKQFWQLKLTEVLQQHNGEALSEYAVDKSRQLTPSVSQTTPFYQYLTPTQNQTLQHIARQCGIGIHGLLLTLLAHETRRRTAKSTIIIGTTLSHQPAIQQSIAGMFVNVVPVPLASPQSTSPLSQQFVDVQHTLGVIGEHGRYPNHLINADFKQQHADVRPLNAHLYDLTLTANPSRFNRDDHLAFTLWSDNQNQKRRPAAGIDLAFHHEQLGDGSLELGLVWNCDSYNHQSAQQWLQGFADWARYICQHPQAIAQPLPRLLAHESAQLHQWQQGSTVAISERRVDQQFSQLAEQTPHAIAIMGSDHHISRRTLENQANSIAALLLAQNIAPKQVVAVQAQCNTQLPAIILALFKLGAIYLPLAEDVPIQRQAFMLNDANAKAIITAANKPLDSQLSIGDAQLITLPSLLPRHLGPAINIATELNHPAYIIYTSGTTGKPKGVVCRHDSLINCLTIIKDAIDFSHQDILSLVSSPGFDASILEFGLALHFGAALVPIVSSLRDSPWAMKRYYQQKRVTCAFHTPSYIRISQDTPFDSLRVLMVGGEALNHKDIRRLPSKLRFFNVYGPTETTIIVSINELRHNLPEQQPIAVGKTMNNVMISIRDPQGERLPPGATGEIWIGGVSVSSGYLNRPKLNHQAFIESAEGTYYRSGDLGRWDKDGQLVILGRIDQQVKLHGQRLELKEIESAINQLPQVDKCAVLVHQSANQTQTLQAFVCVKTHIEPAPEQWLEQWRESLATQLPPYMVPANFTIMDSLAVTSSGKLDRQRLLDSITVDQSHLPAAPPKAGLESTIADIWQQVLNRQGTQNIQRTDNFFSLGGNSLVAITIAHQLSQQLHYPISPRILYAAPILSDFARKIAALEKSEYKGDNHQANKGTNKATASELEFWIAQKAQLDTRTSTILVQRPIASADHSAQHWDKAWHTLVARHSGLRSYYQQEQQADGNSLVCRHVAQVDKGSNHYQLQHHQVAHAQQVQPLIRQWQSKPLDMSCPPLWRAGVITATEQNNSTGKSTSKATFWLAMHHAIADGHSIGILLNELSAILNNRPLKPITVDLHQAAWAYEHYQQSQEAEQDRQYWQQVADATPVSAYDEWPLDFDRQNPAPVGTHRYKTYLDKHHCQGLLTLASSENASLHATMLSVFALEAQRRTGRTQFNLGTTASIRENAEHNQLLGCFVNLLPLPYQLTTPVNFRQLLADSQQQLMAALVHQRTPFADIYHQVWAKHPSVRDPLRFPLFDFVVTENPAKVDTQDSQDTVFGSDNIQSGHHDYEFTPWPPGQDMALVHERQRDGRLLLEIHVNAEIYSQHSAHAWFGSLVGWAKWLADNHNSNSESQQQPLPIPALLPQEKTWLALHQTGPIKPRPALNIAQLFEQQVVRSPNQAAIVSNHLTLSYQQLNQLANQIGHQLFDLNIKPGYRVGVLTQRSGHLAAAMLACFKAGGVYVPLNAELPDQRLADMVQDCQCQVLLVLDGLPLPPLLADAITTVIRPQQCSDNSTGNLVPEIKHPHAYILFTSGSTGRPKGTLVGHKALTNLSLSMVEAYQMTPSDKMLGFSSPSFDVSLSDLTVPLIAGATVYPASTQQVNSATQMIDLINHHQITIVDITPSYLRLLSDAPLSSVRILITGGEAPFAEQVNLHSDKRRYFNAYGPTENTITSTIGRLTPASQQQPSQHFSCGQPLPNTWVEIRNQQGDLVAPGVIGEVWLGGDNLAIEYINDPEQTASAFVNSEAGRCYRSGDLGRQNAQGQLEIVGRIDEQVKLNGIRVETAEIEAVINQHPAIDTSVIAIDFNRERSFQIAAFICLKAQADQPTLAQWQDYLRPRLPHYMQPSRFHVIAKVPTNQSGKIDKKALLQTASQTASVSQVAPLQLEQLRTPETQLSQLIAATWAKHLYRHQQHSDKTPLYLEDNFFSLGGHSLLAIAVATDLEQQLAHPIAAQSLFVAPTLEQFSQLIAEQRQRSDAGSASISAVNTDLATSHLATRGQQEFWRAQQAGLDTRGFNLKLTVNITGQQLPQESKWSQVWATLVAHHPSLSASFYQDHNDQLLLQSTGSLKAQLIFTTAKDSNSAQNQAEVAQSEPFDMICPPLWRAGLITISANRQLFWLSLHHSIADGWSLGIIWQQLQALHAGHQQALPPTVPLNHMAAQEQHYFASSQAEQDQVYWQQQLTELANNHPDSFDEWPLDMPRAHTGKSHQGSHCLRVILSKDISDGLRELAKRNQATVHSVMLSLMSLEITRRTGRQSFVVGTVSSTRDSHHQAAAIGYYINMLPVICKPTLTASINHNIQAIHQTLVAALTHHRYPFAEICADVSQAVAPQRHPNRLPIFDFAVTENPAINGTERLTHLPWQFELPQSNSTPTVVTHQQLPAGPAQDMVLVHQTNSDGTIELILFANANIYLQSTAHNWLTALSDNAVTLAQDQSNGTQALPSLTVREIHWLEQRHGQIKQWPAPTFHQAFSAMANTYPEHIALKYSDHGHHHDIKTISYQEMEQLTHRLAQQLFDLGISGGIPVAVLAERSPQLPIIALAIFKAGGCYLPLSTELPKERMAYICQDAKPKIVITLDNHAIPSVLANLPAVTFSANQLSTLTANTAEFNHGFTATGYVENDHQLPKVNPQQAAYIIYTSGSTGTPKGVIITHRGWNNFAHGVAQKLTVTASDSVLLCAAVSFDAWLSDVGMAWVSGASLAPVTSVQMNDISQMKQLIKQFAISHAVLSPSYLRLFEQQGFEQVDTIMTMGEPPQTQDVQFFSDKLNYYNGYGPTENSGATCIGPLHNSSNGQVNIHTGTPLPNITVYILDQQLRLLPPGSIGFIHTTGDSLGQGYLNLPEQTAHSFIDSRYGRIYNTGDLGRWNQQGCIEVLGRADSQVKLRGQRVELAEIEAVIEQYPGIQQAAVLVDRDSHGVQSLWGFVVQQGNQSQPSQRDWQQFISQSLPSYMVPAAVFSVPQMPKTIAGKLDQAALLQRIEQLQQVNQQSHSSNHTPPKTLTEKHIAQLWHDLFPNRKIAREDDFFALGGDSIRAIGLINALRNDYQCHINLLYENPILMHFAAHCRPHPAHLLQALTAAKQHWQQHRAQISAHEHNRQQTLAPSIAEYRQNNQAYQQLDLSQKRHYRYILLTGATGYLGAYLLQHLLQITDAHLYLIVRGADDLSAKQRLASVLEHYFQQPTLAEHHRLTIWSGDLRQPDLGLSAHQYQQLVTKVDAIYHSAANVNHFGHYDELYASNVTATANLIDLAVASSNSPRARADFHHVSTLSVVGEAPQSGFELFTEYSPVPPSLAENYYTRTKQLAETLVIEARSQLGNACIHRVGNVVFAAHNPVLQKDISSNAFFRQLAAFIHIGKVPDDIHVWLCHVDYLAKAIVAISQPKAIVNQTHHLEHHYRHPVADLLTHPHIPFKQPQSCDFGQFVQTLIDTHQQPELAKVHGELVEAFGLMRAKAPQVNGSRIEVITERTQSILKQLNFTWPDVPLAGLKQLLSSARCHFSPKRVRPETDKTGY